MSDGPAKAVSERARPAPHLLRILAWWLDFLLILLVFIKIQQPVNLAVFLGLFIVYHTVLTWLAQRTPGKALLGLRIERVAGRKPDFLWALGRASLGYFVIDVLGAGTVIALLNRQHRCPHDYFCGSVVTFPGSRLKGLRAIQTRFQGYVDQLKSGLSERFKTTTAFAALLEILGKLAEGLRTTTAGIGRALGYGGSGSAQGTYAGALSLKASAIILAATTAMTGTVLVTVPLLRHAAADMFKAHNSSGAGVNGQNLIANGDAEAGPGSLDFSVVSVPLWKTTEGEFTVVQYTDKRGDLLSLQSPGPEGRGHNYFAGGKVATSSAMQLIEVSTSAAAIDTGKTRFRLSGYLGGYAEQEDNAVLTATFLNAEGKPLGTASIGPVTAVDRKQESALLERTTSGIVPVATRRIEVQLRMTRVEGQDNDGYADNLSLVLLDQ
jgi:uncharacterized RDD family membrane protein YckC